MSEPRNPVPLPGIVPIVPQSATLAINEAVRGLVAAGEDVVHLGFGEAGLPAAPALVERLRQAAGANDYRPSSGGAPLREAVAGYFTRRGLPCGADDVVAGPGSKALLFALIRALPGDLVLPSPSWVSYAAQAEIAGRRVAWAAVPGDGGGVPGAAAFEESIRRLRAEGGDPRITVLTIPDNPTGALASRAVIEAACDVAERYGITIISDEIYRDVAYDQAAVVSPATLLPGQTVVTGGLSKNLAVGGWRLGFARFPATEFGRTLRESVIGLASEIWSSVTSPIEDAAAWALTDPPEIVERVTRSRALHQAVSVAMHDIFAQHGITTRPAGAAFYTYPDFSVWRERLAEFDLTNDGEVAQWLLRTHRIGLLPGSAFGDAPEALRFRVATSLLYGTTAEQREAALASDDPVSLPWIAARLERVGEVLGEVGG